MAVKRDVMWFGVAGSEAGGSWVVVDEVVDWHEHVDDDTTAIGLKSGQLIKVSGLHGDDIARAVTGTRWERQRCKTAGPVNVDANGAPV